MKSTISCARLVVVTSALSFCLLVSPVLAADTNAPVADTSAAQTVVTTTDTAAAAPSATAKLPYGVEDVLKLSRANISEGIILNYVQNSGTIYNLGPQEIVYLRNQGVSDNVLNAMLNQRKQVEAAAQIAQQTAVASAPAIPDVNMTAVAPMYTDVAATYAEPQPAPAASSVYVIPYPQASAAYYGYYSYYGPYGYSYYGPYSCYRPYYYGGYCGPTVTLGFGFGGHGYYGHGYHGHGYAHGHGYGWHH